MKSTATAVWRHRWFVLACAGVAAHALVWDLALRRREAAMQAKTAAEASADISFTAGVKGVVAGRNALEWIVTPAPGHGIPENEWMLNGPLAITPEVAGRFIWLSASRLMFSPSEDWPSCTEFEAVLPAAWTGGSIAPRFKFRSAALNVNSIRLNEVRPDRRCSIQIMFNAPAGDGDISRHLALLDERNQPVKFTSSRHGAGRGLILQTDDPVRADTLRVQVRQGFPAAEGPLGLARTVEEKLTVGRVFALIGYECASPAFDPVTITLRMSQAMDVRTALDGISVVPEVEYAARVNASYGRWDPSDRIIMTGSFEPGRKYAIRLPEDLKSQTQDRITGSRELGVIIPDRAPGLRIIGKGSVLARDGARQIRLETVNVDTLDIRLEKLYPNNLPWFIHRRDDASSRYWWRPESALFTGLSRQIANRSQAVMHRRNRAQETALDLAELAADADAAGIYLLTAARDRLYVEQMINLTRLALSVRHTDREGLALVTSLLDAAPVSGVNISVRSAENQTVAEGIADDNGLFRWKSGDATPAAMIIASTADDTTYLNLREARLTLPDPVDGIPYPAADLEAWLLSERNLYRPDDQVRIAALVRDRRLGAAPAALPVRLEVAGPDGKTFTALDGALDDAGTSAFAFALPPGLRTGSYRAELRIADQPQSLGTFTFNVQAFLPPRLEVRLDAEQTGSAPMAPAPLNATLRASYYHGGAAADLPVESFASFQPADFRPDGFDGYIFSDNEIAFSPKSVSLGKAVLDNNGVLRISVPTDQNLRPPSMLRATLAATVQDHDGRGASAVAVIPLHAYKRYAGLKIESAADSGNTLTLLAALVSPDGKPAGGDVELNVMVERLEWTYTVERDSDGIYRYRSSIEAVAVRSLPLPARDGAGQAKWTPPEDGQYRITLQDPLSGARASRIVHAGGPDGYDGTADLANPYRLKLALDDAAMHQPGGNARIHVTSPFSGTALVSVEGPDLFWSAAQTMDKTAATLTVPLPENVRGHGVYCSVTVMRPLQPGARPLPVRASGIIRIPVVRPEATLDVVLEPPPAPLSAGQPGVIAVAVSDVHGKPAAGAAVWLIAVDEAIAALGNWAPPDPLRDLLRNRRLDTAHADPFQMLLPEWGDLPVQRHDAAPGGDMEPVGVNRLNPFRGRRYTPTAWWIGRFTADSDGRISADVRWPAFDGRLRITAVAASARALGAATESRVCRHPVIIRSGLPRVLAAGDRADIAVDIVNRTDDRTLDLKLTLHTEGPLQAQWTDTVARIAPGARHGLTVPVTAGAAAGDGLWRLTASSPDGDITETIVIPVQEIRRRQVIRQAVVIAPGGHNAWPAYPDLAGPPSLILAGNPVPHLQPMLRDLLEYPYGCLEQTVSRVFPLLALRDAGALAAAGITRDGADLRIRQAVQRVLTMQRADGGFGYWPGDGGDTFAWGSVFAAHFLAEAARQGHPVPAATLERAQRWLETAALPGGGGLAADAGDSRRRAIAAYACRALAVAGKPPRNWMRTLHERADLLDAESIAHLAAAFAEDADRRTALELLRRTESLSALPPAGADDGHLAGELRTLAVIADGWRRQDPSLPESVASVFRLSSAVGKRSWLNTQEQAWSLTALLPAATATAGEPVSARLVQDDIAEDLTIPAGETRTLALNTDHAGLVTLGNTGKSQLYAQSTHVVTVAVTNEAGTLPVANGLRIRRRWLDRGGEPLTENAVRSGDLVVAEISIENLNGQSAEHVVITDRFPAGLEPESSVQALAVTLPWLSGRGTLPLRYTDMRDDRALFFTGRFSGAQTMYYALRAVTPGHYHAAPVGAEQMYDAAVNALGTPGAFEVLP